MNNPIDEYYPSGWWDEYHFMGFDPRDLNSMEYDREVSGLGGFDPQDPNSMEYDGEASGLGAEPLAQPKAVETSPAAELVTRMEIATAGSFENDLHNAGKAESELIQQDYQHDDEQQSKLTEDEIKAPFDFWNSELGYDPLSADLTPEQEAMEKIRTRDAALDIYGRTVLEGDLNKEWYDVDLSPIDNLEIFPDFNFTDREFQEVLDTSFGKTLEQRSMVTEGSSSNQHPQKRPKMSTKVLQAQATLQPSGSTTSKIPSFEDTDNREVVYQRKRKEQAERRNGNKTTKNVFEAVARSQNPASSLNAASPVPQSARWSWDNSSTFRPIAPRPSPQSSFEDGFNTPRVSQALTSQGYHPSSLAPRGHQRQKSNQSNLLFAGPVQPSFAPAYGAGSPQGNQGTPSYSPFGAGSPQGNQGTPTHPRSSRTSCSRRRGKMAGQTTPAQTPVTPTTPTAPTPEGLASLPRRPPGPLPNFTDPPIRQPTTPTTPTPEGLASLPRRPPGPLPNFTGPPIRQPNFGLQSPAPGGLASLPRRPPGPLPSFTDPPIR